MIRFAVAFLLAASTLDAAIVDRVAAAVAKSEVRDSIGGPVVASGDAFLVLGQRISSNGIVLDAEPVAGANGHAAAWSDGWLAVRSDGKVIRVGHLPATGVPELILSIPSPHWILEAASAGDRLAILERGQVGDDVMMWLTVTDGTGILHRAPFRRAEGAKLVRLGEGFLVVSWEREPDFRRTLRAWLFDRNGALVRFRTIETSAGFDIAQVRVASLGAKAVITTRISSDTRFVVIDESLATTRRTSIAAPGITTWWSTPLTGDDRFFLTYYRTSPPQMDRVVIVRTDGTIVADEPTDPIAYGDRAGDRYLVVRPWGHAAIAKGDPRAIVMPAIQLRVRTSESLASLDTVVSEDVTLVAFGRHSLERFVRVEPDGMPIDAEPQDLPARSRAFTATPDGFALATRGVNTIEMQRLTRRDGWIDPEPVTIASAPEALGIAIHANDRDMLVAWTTRSGIHWLRVDLDGTPIDLVPSRVAHLPRGLYSGDPARISISGRGSDRLVLVQDTFVCVVLCETPKLMLEALALDGEGRALGPATIVDSWSSSRTAVGLADGTWVVQVDRIDDPANILHLARDGSILDSTSVPELSGGIVDARPTENGWEAIADRPLRLVTMEGASTATRMTGLLHARLPRFASGGRIAFVERSDDLESIDAAWTGRVATVDGDLALDVTDLGRDTFRRYLGITVHNLGTADATGVFVASSRLSPSLEPVMVPDIRPGEGAHVVMTVPMSAYDETIRALSIDVTDIDPSNNAITVFGADPRPPRRHPVRP